MGKLLRLSLALGALTAVFAGFNLARPSWAAGTGADVWALPELVQAVEEGQAKTTELEELARRIQMRAEGRRQVVNEVIAGRMSLVEAAVRMRELDGLVPGGQINSEAFPGKSEGERYCRRVIRWVEVELSDEALAERERAVRRLEQDLSELLRSDGTVHLPVQ